MDDTPSHTGRDLIFGARVHDPDYWREHPLVIGAETHFDGAHGWIGLSLRPVEPADTPGVRAIVVTPEATAEGPDIYLFGEFECPVTMLEHAPRLRALLISVSGPVSDDDRETWTAGLWLDSGGSP